MNEVVSGNGSTWSSHIASPGTEPLLYVSDGAGTIQAYPLFSIFGRTSTLQVLAEWRNGAQSSNIHFP